MPNEKTRRIRLTTATIKVDSCGITIKGKKLEVGVPIEDWIKVLGKPSRVVGHYVWDDLGIGVSNDNNSEKIVDALYIYFMNLNSEDGKAGMLYLSFRILSSHSFVNSSYPGAKFNIPEIGRAHV